MTSLIIPYSFKLSGCLVQYVLLGSFDYLINIVIFRRALSRIKVILLRHSAQKKAYSYRLESLVEPIVEHSFQHALSIAIEWLGYCNMDEKPVITGLCVVDFHHTRGPETEYWCSLPAGTDETKIWPNLPFQALPDGSHSFKETFTYFTLLYNEKKKCSPENGATEIPEDELQDYITLFAISCSRQIRSNELLQRGSDITRSTVQKAVVVISRQPIFGQIKDKLSLVTNAFFLQRDFSDRTIISSLYESLTSMFKPVPGKSLEGQFYVGLSLRKIIYDLKKDILVLLKALLLEKQIIFYGTNVEALCNLQFGLISLIPNLLSSLQNCGSPQLYKRLEELSMATSFKSSDRKSVLAFLGFPLRIFERGGLFSPYTPLQQMDDIRSRHTQFFMIGSSNSLLVEQKTELCHIFVDVDSSEVEIIDKSLSPALQLSGNDKKWIDSIVNIVTQSWNENDLYTPKNSQFEGSEDFIRWQFEDYLTGLLSSVKLSEYVTAYNDNQMALQSLPEEMLRSNPIQLFNNSWIAKWKQSENYSIFRDYTDDRLFDIFPPKHPYDGPDTMTILQQKLAATFQNLKKTSSHVTGDMKIKDNDSQASKEQLVPSPSVKSKDSSKESNASEKEQNLWSTWKDYFNGKKKGRKREDRDVVKSTEYLNNSNSTQEAIGSALVGLGLHYDSAAEALDSESEGESSAADMNQSPTEASSIGKNDEGV